MHLFKDTTNREWQISITVNSVKRVRDLAEGFDLLKVVEDSGVIARLTSDPFILVAVLYALVKPQADAQGVTPEGFGEALGSGDVLAAAADAVLEEIADFFPPHKRGPLKAAVAKLKEIQATAASMAVARIESPELMTQAVKAIGDQLAQPLPTSGG
jgi:hypothetical protein